MKITSIHIENLLSFKSAKFLFGDYNVIVGPNGNRQTRQQYQLQKLRQLIQQVLVDKE